MYLPTEVTGVYSVCYMLNIDMFIILYQVCVLCSMSGRQINNAGQYFNNLIIRLLISMIKSTQCTTTSNDHVHVHS